MSLLLNCSYTPRDKEKGYIKPYAEIHQLHPPATAGLGHGQSLQHLSSNGHAHAPLLSSQEGRVSREKYDILRPPTPPPGVKGEEHLHSVHALRSSNSPPRHPSHSSPSIRTPGKLRPEDTDTYVFMAPVTDFGSDLDVSRSPLSPLVFKTGENEGQTEADTRCGQLTFLYSCFTEKKNLPSMLGIFIVSIGSHDRSCVPIYCWPRGIIVVSSSLLLAHMSTPSRVLCPL